MVKVERLSENRVKLVVTVSAEQQEVAAYVFTDTQATGA